MIYFDVIFVCNMRVIGVGCLNKNKCYMIYSRNAPSAIPANEAVTL